MGVSVKAVEAHITLTFHDLQKKLGGKMGSVLFLLFGKMNAKEMGI